MQREVLALTAPSEAITDPCAAGAVGVGEGTRVGVEVLVGVGLGPGVFVAVGVFVGPSVGVAVAAVAQGSGIRLFDGNHPTWQIGPGVCARATRSLGVGTEMEFICQGRLKFRSPKADRQIS